MRIVIVGPGAMGCLFGSFFLKNKGDVYFLDKDEERAKLISQKGIYVEGLSNFSIKKVKITTRAKEIKEADLFIIATKSYSTDSAVRSILPILNKEAFVLTLQNGLGNIEIISKYIPLRQIIAGTTAEGATLLDVGHIRHAGIGETFIGQVSKVNQKSKIEEIVKIFNKAGFETKLSKNIEGLIWSKLIINVGINALTALTRLKNGRILEYPHLRKVMEAAVKEAYRIAKRKRIKLVYSDPVEKVEEVCIKTSGNISSMLQDVLKKRKTEIDFINGAIVREGKKLGISTPINWVLTNLVKAIEASYNLSIP